MKTSLLPTEHDHKVSDLTDPPNNEDEAESDLNPPCVLVFNASDPSGAGGLAGDVSTIAAMGAHALPVVTSIILRDGQVSAQHVGGHPSLALTDQLRGPRRHVRIDGTLSAKRRRDRQKRGGGAEGTAKRDREWGNPKHQ